MIEVFRVPSVLCSPRLQRGLNAQLHNKLHKIAKVTTFHHEVHQTFLSIMTQYLRPFPNLFCAISEALTSICMISYIVQDRCDFSVSQRRCWILLFQNFSYYCAYSPFRYFFPLVCQVGILFCLNCIGLHPCILPHLFIFIPLLMYLSAYIVFLFLCITTWHSIQSQLHPSQ